MKALVLGATGGIGSEVVKLLEKQNYEVIKPPRKEIDLNYDDGELQLNLREHNPDVIINCAGVFARNDELYFDKIFSVNVRSNWIILDYYRRNPPKKPVTFIMIGSSAAFRARRDYMLYAASKTALANLYESAQAYFDTSNLDLRLFSPPRVRTKMNPEGGIEPSVIAKRILKLI